MGCFLACFGSSKEEKRRNQRKHKVLLRDQRYGSATSLRHRTLPTEKVISAEPFNPKTDPPVEVEEELSLIAGGNITSDTNLSDGVAEELSFITKKKVTFDTNVKTYEPVALNESTELLLSETAKKSEEEQKYISERSSLVSNSHSEDDSITSSVGSFPPNHRYQNCRDSDDEIDEFECEDCDLDDENDDIARYIDSDEDEDEDERETLNQKVWAESVPTASMESSTQISSVLAASDEVDSARIVRNVAEKEETNTIYNQNARNRSAYVHPVLNPVENIAQWKAAKLKETPHLKPQKENFRAKNEESRLSFSFMSKSDQSADQNQDISVDTSLSNWLPYSKTPVKKTSIEIESEMSYSKSTPVKKTSVEIESEMSYSPGSISAVSLEDRPILGALTVEEIKQFSAKNSRHRSPSRSPDEMAIIGTVGRYWNSSGCSTKDSNSASSYKGIPNSTSKYREDKKVIWHSTPFETRLEKALKEGNNEA